MLKSVFEVSCFLRKTPLKRPFFQNFEGMLFLPKWLHEYPFWPGLRHLSVLSKKYSSATLVNIRQKL